MEFFSNHQASLQKSLSDSCKPPILCHYVKDRFSLIKSRLSSQTAGIKCQIKVCHKGILIFCYLTECQALCEYIFDSHLIAAQKNILAKSSFTRTLGSFDRESYLNNIYSLAIFLSWYLKNNVPPIAINKTDPTTINVFIFFCFLIFLLSYLH